MRSSRRSAPGTRAARSARPRKRRCWPFAVWLVGEDGDFITPEELPKFGSEVAAFDKALEEHVVSRGWFTEKPSKVVGRWTGRGVLAIVGGVIALIAGLNIPFSGLTLIGVAAIIGGIVVIGFAQAMPAVTMPGAMIRAMLAAYRRTLQKTMAQARSMEQVVAEAGLDWLDTPGSGGRVGHSARSPERDRRASCRAASRTSRRVGRRAPCPTSRSGTRTRAVRR